MIVPRYSPIDRAMLALARATKDLSDCNPEVGMGPGYRSLLNDACKAADINSSDFDYFSVLSQFKGGGDD